MREMLKTTGTTAAVTLLCAFIGVMGGREVVGVELRHLKESTTDNAAAIAKNTEQMNLLIIQVHELTVATSKGFESMAHLEQRVASIENWKVDIQSDRDKRGVIIPDLMRRLDKLEQRR